MTQQHLPQHGNTAPPTEPFTSLDDTVRGTAEDVVRRSRRARRRKLGALAAAVLVAVVSLVVVLATRSDKPPAAAGMTQQLAVSFVQDEYPQKFKDPAKLIVLFEATCGVLEEGGSRPDAILPLLQANLSQQEAAYIYDMSVRSTCPQYA